MNVLILIFTTVQMIKSVRIQLGVSSVHVEKDLYLEVMDQLVNVSNHIHTSLFTTTISRSSAQPVKINF